MVTTNLYIFHSIFYCLSEAQQILFLCEGIGVLLTFWWTICKYLSFNIKVTYLPVHLLPFYFSYANVQFDKNSYPEMQKFCKNYENNIIPCPIFMFQNMSEQCQC